MGLTLDTLPEAIVFDICNWLDIFDLVALSEVNRALRTLANTRSSFWLETLSSTNLILSFIDSTTLGERDAKELSAAAHHAVFLERNLTSTSAKLHSWRHIPWPFDLSQGVPPPSQRALDETAIGTIKMHLVDTTGEWMIFVSSKNIIRVVHLRTGKVAAVFDKLYYSDKDLEAGATFVWGVEMFYLDTGIHKARMVMSCSIPNENPDDPVTPGLAVLEMDLNPANSLVDVQLVGFKPLSSFALMADVAGPFVVTIVPDTRHDKEGKVTMFRWVDWTPIKLPPLYPASKCCLFEEYFISIGYSSNRQLFLQIVAYPYKSCHEKSPDNFDLTKHEIDRFLQIPLPLQSFHVPYTKPFSSGSSGSGQQPLFRLCHRYSGQQYNTVHLWIRSPGYGAYHIFNIEFDLFDLRTRGEKVATGSGGDTLSLVQHFIGPSETKRVLQEEGLRHYAVATPSGRRYLWWRPTPYVVKYAPPNPFIVDSESSSGEEKGGGEREGEGGGEELFETLQLYTSSTDGLLPFSEMPSYVLDQRYRVRLKENYAPGTASARQLEGVRRLPVPKSLACMQGDLFLFLLVESCGTAIVQLTNGSFWVLRYGKA